MSYNLTGDKYLQNLLWRHGRAELVFPGLQGRKLLFIPCKDIEDLFGPYKTACFQLLGNG